MCIVVMHFLVSATICLRFTNQNAKFQKPIFLFTTILLSSAI